MGRYQVAAVARPENWQPDCLDDVPLELAGPVEVLGEADDLFAAVEQAVSHNESPSARQRMRWAVVVEPGAHGRIWPAARLCTPLCYKVTAIWWPEGWNPHTPLDVPNCVWQDQGRTSGQWLNYDEAEAAVRGLNQQCMNTPGTTWYVVVAVENEPFSQTISYDQSGTETTVEVRRIHVIRPKDGGTGDCTYCPARDFPCAKTAWTSQAQTVTAQRSRVPEEE
ncbi:MAG: hypothetical protein JXB10_14605 [Pirellulales bacterium]|nr:hypothetical protein [Pirellulales bacterium]